MAIELKTHHDMARAFAQLGLPSDVLLQKSSRIEKALDAHKAQNPALVRALKDALDDMKSGERARLAAAIGDTSRSTTNAGVAQTTSVGGGGAVLARLQHVLDGKGRLTENTPDVALLLNRYGEKGPVDRPFERVLVHTAKIDAILRSERDPDKLVDVVMKGDLRRQVFLLEGIAKLYQDIHGTVAEDVYVNVKKLEDALGAYSMTRSNTAAAQKLGAPAAVIAQLQSDEGKARAAVRDLLADEWMPNDKGRSPGIKDIVKEWGDAKWGSTDKDLKAVRKELSRRLEKLDATTYDMNDLQGGIHEYRRQLRWIPIYAEAFNGLVVLEDKKSPIAAYDQAAEAFKDPKLSKYLDLPAPDREKETIAIPRDVYAGLMQLTLDLGALKDEGEPLEFIAKAYVDAGVSKDLASAQRDVARLSGAGGAEDRIHAEAHRLYGETRRNGLVDFLKDTFAG